MELVEVPMAVVLVGVSYRPDSTIHCHSSHRTIVLSHPQCRCFLLVQCCVLPAESFVSFVASSEWIAKANRIVVVVIESFSSILSFSFVADVVTVVSVAVVSSVAFAFVLSFSFAFSFVTVVLTFSFVDSINVHGCLLLHWMIVIVLVAVY